MNHFYRFYHPHTHTRTSVRGISFRKCNMIAQVILVDLPNYNCFIFFVTKSSHNFIVLKQEKNITSLREVAQSQVMQ